MATSAVAKPKILTDPGVLFIAPLATAVPAHTQAGGVFTDTWPAAWIPLGATTEGSEFSYNTEVEAITVAEFLDPIKQVTTGREGSIAFNLASYTLTNYRRALNGGIAALVADAGGITSIKPPKPGTEVRSQIGWESLDGTLRLVCYQTLQGGEISSSFSKAPDIASIPCSFVMEVPETGDPWEMWSTRG